MPLKPAHLLAVKDGVVELSEEIVDPQLDRPESLAELIRARIAEHQVEVMTDDAILDPPSTRVASVFECRDAIPPDHRTALAQLGLEPGEAAGATGAAPPSIFDRLRGRGRARSRLERWRVDHRRAADLSPGWGRLEEALLESVPPGPLGAVAEAAAAVTGRALATHLGLAPARGRAALEALDRAWLGPLGAAPRGRYVLLPVVVRGLAAWAGEAIRAEAPDTVWSEDPEDEAPLYVQAPGGVVVRTDPALRVVELVARGRAAPLADWAERLLGQSLTDGAQA